MPLNNINNYQAYILNCDISILQVGLVVPYIFSQLCKLILKIILWPVDLYYYRGMCTFNYAQYQNELLNKQLNMYS